MTAPRDRWEVAGTTSEPPTEEGSFVSVVSTTEPVRSDVLDVFIRRAGQAQASAMVLKTLARCSEATGSYVLLPPEVHYLPSLRDTNEHLVFLYEFVELVDSLLDYGDILAEFSLSYSQIDSAMSFLRKLSMVNPEGLDLDEIEDAEDAEDPTLLEALRSGIEYEGLLRVLDT